MFSYSEYDNGYGYGFSPCLDKFPKVSGKLSAADKALLAKRDEARSSESLSPEVSRSSEVSQLSETLSEVSLVSSEAPKVASLAIDDEIAWIMRQTGATQDAAIRALQRVDGNVEHAVLALSLPN